jgi:hypothetical protein
MMSMPSEEKMRGSQSMKLMCTGGSLPFFAECDHTAASTIMKKARENCNTLSLARIRYFMQPFVRSGGEVDSGERGR